MRSRIMRLALPCILIPAAPWLLRKVERDYEERGRLSPGASAAGWALYLLHAAATLSIARRSSSRPPAKAGPQMAMGSILTILGSVLYAVSARRFASPAQMSGREPGGLVTSGPYRFSRNPQLVGWGLVLGGISLAGRSPRALLLVAAFFLAHELYLPIVERHLELIFGKAYRRYRAEVPRYLYLPVQGQDYIRASRHSTRHTGRSQPLAYGDWSLPLHPGYPGGGDATGRGSLTLAYGRDGDPQGDVKATEHERVSRSQDDH